MVESRTMMDTLVSIKAWGPPEIAESAINAGFQAMENVDRMASFYRPDSALSMLNHDRRVCRAGSFSTLMENSEAAFKATGGFFDPTFSTIARAWGFYDGNGRQPSSEELRECLSRCGWDRQIRFENFEGEEVVSLASGASIDLGGIAGGFAIQEAASAMRDKGCSTFFIDDGGDLWMEGKKPDGSIWKVAVRDPRDNGILAEIVSAAPVAISTSGDYERFVMVDGRRINHIFDLLSGRPAECYRSVTVVSNTPLSSDIWSTALFSMDPATARSTSVRENLAALFLPASGPAWISEAGRVWFRKLKQ
ncbi:hypothetical protein AUK22_07315 [bacterium CG2_30_54_10]|nr:MAG: hypothetical protein AUK22_07315 [bacterium CG2_30_54_10]